MDEKVPKLVFEIEVPERKAGLRSGDQVGRRRDFIKQTLSQNISGLQTTYHVSIKVTKDGERGLIVEVPVLEKRIAESEEFRNLLFKGTDKWEHTINISYVDSGNHRETIRPGREVSADIVSQLNDYRSLGLNAAALRTNLDRLALYEKLEKDPEILELRLSEMETSIGRMQEVINQIKEESVVPDSLSLEDLAVLIARRICGKEYSECAKKFDEIYPEGIDTDVRLALELTKKGYVLSSEIIEMCGGANGATINVNQHSIDDILEEARERSGPFEESSFFTENFCAYTGARAILLHSRKEPKRGEERVGEDILTSAREIHDDFEEERETWNKKRDLAGQVYEKMKERGDMYDLATEFAPDRRLELTVPIVTFSNLSQEGREYYIVLPTTQETEKSALTKTLRWELLQSAKESFAGRNLKKSVSEIVEGSRVISFYIINDILGETEAIDKDVYKIAEDMEKIGENYKRHSLYKLGIKIRMFHLGEK